MTVPTPTVRANVGTLEMSLSKNRALASMVSFANVFTRVLDINDEPGSLKAIWPSLPIPVKQEIITFFKEVKWLHKSLIIRCFSNKEPLSTLPSNPVTF